MPKFELINKEEAQSKATLGGKNGQVMAMYMFFIEQLKENKAGRLRPAEGETIQAVRRRLGKAAKLTGKEITIRRVNDEVYFWLEPEEKPRNRKRKSANKSTRMPKIPASQNDSKSAIQINKNPINISQETHQLTEENVEVNSQEDTSENEDELIIQWKERIEKSNDTARRNLQMNRGANTVKSSG